MWLWCWRWRYQCWWRGLCRRPATQNHSTFSFSTVMVLEINDRKKNVYIYPRAKTKIIQTNILLLLLLLLELYLKKPPKIYKQCTLTAHIRHPTHPRTIIFYSTSELLNIYIRFDRKLYVRVTMYLRDHTIGTPDII